MLAISDYLLLCLFGILGSFLSGFLGVGGGIIYIPVLDYFLSKLGLREENLVQAILANSLFTILFSGSMASWKQYKMGNFFPKEILQTAWPGMLSALTMTLLIHTGTWYNKTVFTVVFACMLLLIVVRMFAKKPSQTTDTEVPFWKYRFTGLLAGIITAFSGLGGGVIMTPLFTDWMKQSIRKAGSISNGVIPLFALTMALLNLSTSIEKNVIVGQVGLIFLPVVAPMVAAGLIFAPLGVKAAQKTSQQKIRIVFALFTGIVFLKLVVQLLGML